MTNALADASGIWQRCGPYEKKRYAQRQQFWLTKNEQRPWLD